MLTISSMIEGYCSEKDITTEQGKKAYYYKNFLFNMDDVCVRIEALKRNCFEFSDVVSYDITKGFETSVPENDNDIIQTLMNKQLLFDSFCGTTFLVDKTKIVSIIEENYKTKARQKKISVCFDLRHFKIIFKPKKKSTSVFESEFKIDIFMNLTKDLLRVDCEEIHMELLDFYSLITKIETGKLLRIDIDKRNSIIRLSAYRDNFNIRVLSDRITIV